MAEFSRIAEDVSLGRNVVVHGFVNLYGCSIGDDSRIGTFVEIQKGVVVGRRCKIQSHTFICEGVTIEDEVFIGHHVCFINDRLPRAVNRAGRPASEGEWKLEPTRVQHGASIGSGAVILGGLTIGRGAMVGAGAVVTRNVASGDTVVGNPARVLHSGSENATSTRADTK